MEEKPEKRYRQIKINLPEHIAWKIERRIGGNSINSLAKLFLVMFSSGKAGLDFTFAPKEEDFKKAA